MVIVAFGRKSENTKVGKHKNETKQKTWVFTGHDPSRGLGKRGLPISRGASLIGSGAVRILTGRDGAGQEVFKPQRSRRVGSPRHDPDWYTKKVSGPWKALPLTER